jgi:hypothetical protein
MESIFESFNRIKNELGQLVTNAVQRIQAELSGVSDTMDKYLIDEIAKIQTVLAEYEKGMIDVNEVAMTNFNTSKQSMIEAYETLTSNQLEEYKTELAGFENKFEKDVDDILSTFSQQSDSVKEESKTILANEQDTLSTNVSEMMNNFTNQVSSLEKQSTSTLEKDISDLEEEAQELLSSIDKTSSQIKARIDSVQKDSTAKISSFASSAKSQITNTQDTTLSDLEVEAKDQFRLAEQSEKIRKDIISRLERLERNIESIKNELYD